MGGNSSSDQRRQVQGGIFIQLQRTGYISRDIVQGFLHINLEESFQGHLLQITLEGKEETFYSYMRYIGTGKDRKKKRVYVKGFNTIISFSLPIYDFAPQNNKDNFILQPGQWTIPFQLNIADTLPSSMNYQSEGYARCSLTYKLHADIISKDPQVRPLSGVQEIFIGQQTNIIAQLLTQQLLSSPKMTCCCCLSQGNLKLQGSTDKYCYGPNEIINITLNCDFTSYLKTVLSLSISLVGNLVMKSHSESRIHQVESFRQQSAHTIQNKKLESNIQLTVPNNIPLTTNGNLINLQYCIEIKPTIDSCCISKNEPLNLQIVINPTSNQLQYCNIPNQLQIQAPSNWQPTQLQQASFSEQQAYNFQQQQSIFREQQNQIYLQQMEQQTNDLSIIQPNMKDLNKPFL